MLDSKYPIGFPLTNNCYGRFIFDGAVSSTQLASPDDVTVYMYMSLGGSVLVNSMCGLLRKRINIGPIRRALICS